MYTADGTLAAWLKSDGTAVTEGETVLEIETEKALQEVRHQRAAACMLPSGRNSRSR